MRQRTNTYVMHTAVKLYRSLQLRELLSGHEFDHLGQVLTQRLASGGQVLQEFFVRRTITVDNVGDHLQGHERDIVHLRNPCQCGRFHFLDGGTNICHDFVVLRAMVQ